jgi:hypothetical protein
MSNSFTLPLARATIKWAKLLQQKDKTYLAQHVLYGTPSNSVLTSRGTIMKKLHTLAAAAVLALSAVPAFAGVITVSDGSINLPNGLNTDITSVFENVVTTSGQTLRGVGEIATINGLATASYCSGPCELTFRFDNYIVDTITASNASFTGGTLNVYIGFGTDNDFNPTSTGSSAADLTAATNGTLFLTLTGHVDPSGHTLNSAALAGGSFLLGDFSFFGTGLLDVDMAGGGVANINFNTNAIPSLNGPADIRLGSQGNTAPESQPHPNECAGSAIFVGAECVGGSASITATVIPEPGTLGLLGIALGSLGFGLRRRNRGNKA